MIITGTEIYDQIDTLIGSKREQLIETLFLNNTDLIPPSVKWIPIKITGKSKLNPEQDVTVEYEVLSDYLGVGVDGDFFRLPLCPKTAQKIATHMACILPTKLMVDQIWKEAVVKLQPKPISPKKGEASRESSITFRKHNRLIEDQLKTRTDVVVSGNLIAGHKKDVIWSAKQKNHPNNVCIYGWHYTSGNPIQPRTFVHSKSYLDYSHGIRLIKKECKVNGTVSSIEDVLKNVEFAHLISDEGPFDVFTFP